MQNTGFLTEVVEGGLLLGRKLNTFFSVTLTVFIARQFWFTFYDFNIRGNVGGGRLHFIILTLREMWGGAPPANATGNFQTSIMLMQLQ